MEGRGLPRTPIRRSRQIAGGHTEPLTQERSTDGMSGEDSPKPIKQVPGGHRVPMPEESGMDGVGEGLPHTNRPGSWWGL